MPTVSIIMGVYNCNNEKELDDSINSIINQTYRDWEFIICNDGSTNKTLELLKDEEKKDSRIKVISYKKNHGLAYALNKCIEVSSGIYIARQDSDDISKNDRIEKQLDFIEENKKVSMVGCICDVIDENGIWGELLLPENPTKKDFYWNSPFLHPSMLIKKEDLIKAGVYRISKETNRCEDYDLFMRMYSLGMKGYNIQEKLYKYKILIGHKKYRPMKDRIEEAKVRYIGYKSLGLMPKGIIYILKPIIIGLIPWSIFKLIRKNSYNNS
ncbi:glycosyltransferase [Clostridium tyrobutyricum]|uniref:glycosyltransferase n=1 Tax=Clostridium tyrobutyricum TaxID=1519 RepID=UPI00073D6374|nr:glycosyltransferase [Clostridium tyrobutyricum]